MPRVFELEERHTGSSMRCRGCGEGLVIGESIVSLRRKAGSRRYHVQCARMLNIMPS